jgi:hypothetical protein
MKTATHRQRAVFFRADADYGGRGAKGLGLKLNGGERPGAMSREERAKATAG